jgi:hypothetical protein
LINSYCLADSNIQVASEIKTTVLNKEETEAFITKLAVFSHDFQPLKPNDQQRLRLTIDGSEINLHKMFILTTTVEFQLGLDQFLVAQDILSKSYMNSWSGYSRF